MPEKKFASRVIFCPPINIKWQNQQCSPNKRPQCDSNDDTLPCYISNTVLYEVVKRVPRKHYIIITIEVCPICQQVQVKPRLTVIPLELGLKLTFNTGNISSI